MREKLGTIVSFDGYRWVIVRKCWNGINNKSGEQDDIYIMVMFDNFDLWKRTRSEYYEFSFISSRLKNYKVIGHIDTHTDL